MQKPQAVWGTRVPPVSLSRRRRFAVAAVSLTVFGLILAGCGTGKPATSPYSCGTPSRGHCYGIEFGPPSLADPGQATRVSMLMNTISPASSGCGDLFFTDETWLTEGSNEIASWVEAGQIHQNAEGLLYFWAEMFVPQNRDPQ